MCGVMGIACSSCIKAAKIDSYATFLSHSFVPWVLFHTTGSVQKKYCDLNELGTPNNAR